MKARNGLRVAGLAKSYASPDGPVPVLAGVDLTLAPGETLALTGESGSGKSTLLHLIAALDRPEAGTISLDGARIDDLSDGAAAEMRRDRIGLVFQQFNLVPSLKVGQNIRLQARLAAREDPAWTDHLTDRLGLAALLGRYPEQLSGGQQQRVAIARALAARPRLLLADEPTGNLDEATGDAVLDLVLELVAESGAMLLLVTHSPRLAGRLARHAELRGGRLV